MHIKNLKNVYITGIGGIGISAIAQMIKENGVNVSGSDPVSSYITEVLKDKGINIFNNPDNKNFHTATDLHIYSSAVPKNHPERLYCKQKKIKSISYPEFLGIISKNYHTIAISGTNGKTTTTALVGNIFEDAGLDPTVIVGSIVPKWKSNFRKGNEKFLIVEACEHNAHMLNLNTDDIIITNIEEDHLDFYKDIDHIIKTFQKFIDQNNYLGTTILNNDDFNTKKLLTKDLKKNCYGINEKTDIQAVNVGINLQKQTFDLLMNGKKYSDFTIQLPAKFNIYNALAAISIAVLHNIPIETIKKSISEFKGTWRRFQNLGKYKGAHIISDYAHHPTAVSETIKAAKDFYPGHRIVTVFQPHQHNRTKKLFDAFCGAFDGSDLVILPEIFDVLGREENLDQNISSKDIANQLVKKGFSAIYTKNLQDAKKMLDKNIKKNDIILIMGAGDVYTLAESLK